jgi:hypothetical protein
MGHTRLGWVPKTKKWSAVVEQMSSGMGSGTALVEDIASIAQLTLRAAERGIETAIGDKRLTYVFYLLTQIVLSSRQENWQQQLAEHGISLSKESSCFDLVSEMHTAADAQMASEQYSSDVGELAQKSAGETLAEMIAPKATTLFGSGRDELQSAVRQLSTKAGFARLGQKFFGKFLSHYLNFYLSRITAHQTGSNRLSQIGEISEFNTTLECHCEQSAAIVRDFCGGWVSKTEYQTGITTENTSRFLAVAMRKLRDELVQQETGQ